MKEGVTQEEYIEALENRLEELQKKLEEVQFQYDSLALENQQFKEREVLVKRYLAGITNLFEHATPKPASIHSHVRSKTDVVVMEDEPLIKEEVASNKI